jgi:CheY-like chemotaxis protein
VRPELRALPRADRDFQRGLDALLTAYLETNAGGPPDPQAFESFVRSRYPSASVRPQEALASLGPPQPIWYVHRRDVGPDTIAGQEALQERVGTTPLYSASRVAQMVGLPMSVLVAWDETDGLIRPHRTPGHLALYSRDDLEAALVAKRAFAAGRSTDEVRELLASRQKARPHRRRPLTARKLLVLLAERDRYAAEFSEYFLRTEGYDVEVALAAEEAERMTADLKPELAVVELLISGGAGAELCARLKATTDTMVLAISSLDGSDAALRAGADAFLAKPYDALAFVSAVKDLLGESAILRDSAIADATDAEGSDGAAKADGARPTMTGAS